MELLPHAGKAEISWRVYFESPVECAAQCLVRREGIEHGVLLVISIPGFTPGLSGKRLMVSRQASQDCEDDACPGYSSRYHCASLKAGSRLTGACGMPVTSRS